MDKEMEELKNDLDKEYDDNEVTEKDINQLERVAPVTKAMSDMGTFYKAITTKLTKDNICYVSKRQFVNKEPFDIVQVPDEKLPPGMIAFVAVAKEQNT